MLIEGWGFAPRQAELGLAPFWDSALLALNERAFTAPTEADLGELRDRYGVRWLVVDRSIGREVTGSCQSDRPGLRQRSSGRLPPTLTAHR